MSRPLLQSAAEEAVYYATMLQEDMDMRPGAYLHVDANAIRGILRAAKEMSTKLDEHTRKVRARHGQQLPARSHGQ